MHDFLYLTPYFPPQGRVGALRPLKFCRHLPSLGWRPIVLTDLWSGATLNRRLYEAVPSDIPIVYDYSARASKAFDRFEAGALEDTTRKKASTSRVAQLVPDEMSAGDAPATPAEIKARVLADDNAVGNLVSPEGSAAAVMAWLRSAAVEQAQAPVWVALAMAQGPT